jgi:sec-independent protein translocase protein TatC
VTPPDAISMLGLAIPMALLYEISIWTAKLVEKKRLEEQKKRDAEVEAAIARADADNG